MPALYHKDFIDARLIGDNPYVQQCYYCCGRLTNFDIPDLWDITVDEILKVHEHTAADYKAIHGLNERYTNLNLTSAETEVYVQCCKVCGWWRLLKNFCFSAESWQLWDITFGCVGSLINLDHIDLSTPLEEVRNFLAGRYDQRINIHPRVFEHTVASVFQSLGYCAEVTGYTCDGGIDIVLRKNLARVGVQVKRSKNKITVEQIRSFAGALIAGKYRSGFYVTTADYTPGAVVTAEKMKPLLTLDLYTSQRFSQVLQLAQVKDDDFERLRNDLVCKPPLIAYYGWDVPRNSL